jgi:hypothetical protein
MSNKRSNKAEVLAEVCFRLSLDERDHAIQILRENYPFNPFSNSGRNWTPLEALGIFFRDGFRDRYTGLPLIFPGTLRIISLHLPTDFPFHRNWKTDQCHLAYWELIPTLDHVVPVSRGGADDKTNWVTTSMVKNASKANFTLEELHWLLLPEENDSSWDGLTGWFSEEIRRKPDLLNDAYVARWNRALQAFHTFRVSAAKVLPAEALRYE